MTDARRIAFILPLDGADAGDFAARASGSGERLDAEAIARAFAGSPVWGSAAGSARVVVRTRPPAVGIFGDFDEPTAARIEAAAAHLDHAVGTLRYVGYAEAEEHCATLARKLIDRYGREQLTGFGFTAIPRGGLIVLGMLSYRLGLHASRLDRPPSDGAPLVVVDDCALTGSRFRRFLDTCDHPRIVFAHLCSPADLRTAIEAREPRVEACLAAADLVDHAPARLGDEYPAWRERWMSRAQGGIYWVGQPEHVAFAWNEPDVTIWNPVSEREEVGWRVVPPELCLKNGSLDGGPAVPVQVQAEGPGPFRTAPEVLYADFGERVVVARRGATGSVALEGWGAVFWRSLIEHGRPDGAARSIVRQHGLDGARVSEDLEAFADDLVRGGLLRVAGDD